MAGWFLAIWVAFAGKDGDKLPEKWAPCYQAVKSSCAHMKFLADYEQQLKTYGYPWWRMTSPVFVNPTLQWAVPNSCLNGSPVGPYGSYPAETPAKK